MASNRRASSSETVRISILAFGTLSLMSRVASTPLQMGIWISSCRASLWQSCRAPPAWQGFGHACEGAHWVWRPRPDWPVGLLGCQGPNHLRPRASFARPARWSSSRRVSRGGRPGAGPSGRHVGGSCRPQRGRTPACGDGCGVTAGQGKTAATRPPPCPELPTRPPRLCSLLSQTVMRSALLAAKLPGGASLPAGRPSGRHHSPPRPSPLAPRHPDPPLPAHEVRISALRADFSPLFVGSRDVTVAVKPRS